MFKRTIADGGDGIYLYSKSRLEKIAELQPNMGNPDTLKSFLEYGEEKFPADHKIIFFRDHGGLSGVCYDYKVFVEVQDDEGNIQKIYPHPHLTYDALKNTFAEVYGNTPEEKPFELVGFSACLTGSYELACRLVERSFNERRTNRQNYLRYGTEEL